MEQSIVDAVGSYGPPGLIVLYLMWERATTAKERHQIDRDRIATDKELAASLATLATLIKSGVR